MKRRRLGQRLGGFVLAGGSAFVIDALILSALVRGYGFDPFTARLVAMTAAALWTWQINRHFSFGRAHDGMAREGARYASVVLAAASINYTAYACILLLVPGARPLAALVAGTGISMFVSFFGFDRFVFVKTKGAAAGPPPSKQ
jgi:putative flippase GtrA